MIRLLLGLVAAVLALRLVENLIDLGLVQLTRWLMHRRVPTQVDQIRIELELQRSQMPEQIRAHCTATGCPDAETHITEQLAEFDRKLEGRLVDVAKELHQRAGQLSPTSSWQLYAALGRPNITVHQLRGVAALLVPPSRN